MSKRQKGDEKVDERIISANEFAEEEVLQKSLRPKSFGEYIGQENLKEKPPEVAEKLFNTFSIDILYFAINSFVSSIVLFITSSFMSNFPLFI